MSVTKFCKGAMLPLSLFAAGCAHLDEGEVEKTVASIIKVLEEKFGATLRM